MVFINFMHPFTGSMVQGSAYSHQAEELTCSNHVTMRNEVLAAAWGTGEDYGCERGSIGEEEYPGL